MILRPFLGGLVGAVLAHGRSAEWAAATVMVLLALVLAAPGDTVTLATWRAFVALGVDDAALAVPFAIVGVGRLLALYINGAWHRTPYLRAVGAVLGAGGFAALAMASLFPRLAYGDPLPLIFPASLGLCLFDGLAAYRSGADARVVANPAVP